MNRARSKSIRGDISRIRRVGCHHTRRLNKEASFAGAALKIRLLSFGSVEAAVPFPINLLQSIRFHRCLQTLAAQNNELLRTLRQKPQEPPEVQTGKALHVRAFASAKFI